MDKFKRKLVAAMELPKDITLDLPIVAVTGNEEVLIRNHKGLIEYAEGHVKLLTKIGIVKIFGEKLMFREITAESIEIVGKIDTVAWEEK